MCIADRSAAHIVKARGSVVKPARTHTAPAIEFLAHSTVGSHVARDLPVIVLGAPEAGNRRVSRHGLVDRNHLSSARTDKAITVAPGSGSRWFHRNSMTEETHPARSLAPAPMTGPPALWAMLTSTAWPRGRWRAVLARRLAVGCSPGCAAGPVFPRRVRGCRSR